MTLAAVVVVLVVGVELNTVVVDTTPVEECQRLN